jgi:MoxR-like ATPase
VLPDDVKSLVRPVLAHRLILSPEAVLRGETIDNVVGRILTSVRVPVPEQPVLAERPAKAGPARARNGRKG